MVSLAGRPSMPVCAIQDSHPGTPRCSRRAALVSNLLLLARLPLPKLGRGFFFVFGRGFLGIGAFDMAWAFEP